MITIILKEIVKDGSWCKREFYYYPQARFFNTGVWLSKN